MVWHVPAGPAEGEPHHPDSIREWVRGAMRWRYLILAGAGAAAWIAIGSTSALAAGSGDVPQASTSLAAKAAVTVPTIDLGLPARLSTALDPDDASPNGAGSGAGASGGQPSPNRSSATVSGGAAGSLAAPVAALTSATVSGSLDANVMPDQANGAGAGQALASTGISSLLIPNLLSGQESQAGASGAQTNPNSSSTMVSGGVAAPGSGPTNVRSPFVSFSGAQGGLAGRGPLSGGLATATTTPASGQTQTSAGGPVNGSPVSGQASGCSLSGQQLRAASGGPAGVLNTGAATGPSSPAAPVGLFVVGLAALWALARLAARRRT